MSRQATEIIITEEQKAALENVYRNGAAHSFRMRCLMVLGKANGLSNAVAEARAGQTYQSVLHLVKRFQSYCIASLKWIQPPHYGNKHGLFATAEDILFRVGKQYGINFCRPVA